jgi:hypothetical protein
MKKCSTFLAIKEMQIKTTLRFHLTPVRMAMFKGNDSNKWGQGYGETGILLQCWWECKLVQPLRKAVTEIPQKAKARTPYDPVILLLGIFPEEYMSGYSRDTCTHMFIAALFTIAKLWKPPRCCMTEEWIKKMWYTHTHTHTHTHTQWSFIQP